MAKKKKLTKKEYIDIKIANCDQLIKTASSPEQKEAYEKYRQDWIDKLTNAQKPEVIAAKKAEKERLAIEKAEIVKRDADREEVLKDIAAEKEAKLAATLKQIEELKKLLPNPVTVSDLGQGKTRYEVTIKDEPKPKEVIEPEPEPASEDSIND